MNPPFHLILIDAKTQSCEIAQRKESGYPLL